MLNQTPTSAQTNIEATAGRQNSPLPQKRSWFLITTAVAFLSILGFSIYLQIEQQSLKRKLAGLEQKKTAATSLVKVGTGTDRSAFNTALAIKAELQKIETKMFSWGKILEKIEQTLPKLKETNETLVQFRSYNGTGDGKVLIAATTRPSSFDPYSDIALTIRAFATEPAFRNVFVPTITKSLAPDGATVLSFSINLEYQKPTF